MALDDLPAVGEQQFHHGLGRTGERIPDPDLDVERPPGGHLAAVRLDPRREPLEPQIDLLERQQ